MITNASTTRGAWLGMLAVFAVGAAACVSGSPRSNDDDDGDSASGGGRTVGVGGMLASTSGAGGGAVTNTATGTTVASSGAGAGPPECVYPSGPYGVAQGQIVPPSLSWQGYTPGATTVSTISAEDLFDCDGSKGIDAVVIDTSQYG